MTELNLALLNDFATAKVDLIDRIREGIPPRRFVPGGAPWLLAGKRYLIPAPAGTGKSLFALVVAMDVIAAGGSVAILDVENGADEYARRLEDIIDLQDAEMVDACHRHFMYLEWPNLRISDGEAEQWAEILGAFDLVIFDSSRLALTGVGLEESSNDDYATFVEKYLMPLSREKTTTIVLDNTGHVDQTRSRGASSKADLNEVVYVAEEGLKFDRHLRGHLELSCMRTRFSELPEKLRVPMGDGVYGPVEVDGAQTRPVRLMELISAAVEEEPGRSRNKVLEAVTGKRESKAAALQLLVDEGFVRREKQGAAHLHFLVKPFREAEEGGSRLSEGNEGSNEGGSPVGPGWVPSGSPVGPGGLGPGSPGPPPLRGDPGPTPEIVHVNGSRS